MKIDVRDRLFRAGSLILGCSVALYIVALIVLPRITPLQDELRAGAWSFLMGTVMNLISIVLVIFGRGWKRVPPVIIATLGIVFWYGFTLY